MNLNCNELREEFEQNRAEKILAARRVNNILQYLVQMKDTQNAEIIPALEVKMKWPQKLIAYLQRHMEWSVPVRRVNVWTPDEVPKENRNPTGRALEISCE